MPEADTPPLRVRHLSVRFRTGSGVVRAVDDVSFSVPRGHTLGVVGESGAGKSTLALAILGLHDPARTTVSGEVRIGEQDIVGMPEPELRHLRGRRVALIVQNPLSALHPAYTAGRQIGEAYRAHHPAATRAQARRRAIEMLYLVGIPDPADRVDRYPHEFSGGMRQRIMIAMALVNEPSLVIADEPTTALDVTVQAQILDLLQDLQRSRNSALVLITHNIDVVRRLADHVLVMYAGRAVETGAVDVVTRRPGHPYTEGLLASVPSMDAPTDAELASIPGSPPNLADLPTGCAFHPRCRYAELTAGRSRTEVPRLRPAGEPGHLVACHLAEYPR